MIRAFAGIRFRLARVLASSAKKGAEGLSGCNVLEAPPARLRRHLLGEKGATQLSEVFDPWTPFRAKFLI
jgi:hypothetical protein